MTPAEISTKLETLPALIARKTEIAIDKWQEWQSAEETLKSLKAKKVLEFKAELPKFSIEILKARVDMDTEVQRLDVVIKEAVYKGAEKEVTKLDDELQASKMCGRLIMQEMRSLNVDIKEKDEL